jgi:hypothetical protein
VSQVVVSLQFQDITRQEIQHAVGQHITTEIGSAAA